MKEYYEIVVLTASERDYANIILDFIEGENDGFWIVDANGNTIECFFPSADRKNYDPQPLKFLLRQGVYKVFPNLKENQRKATVKISLKYI